MNHYIIYICICNCFLSESSFTTIKILALLIHYRVVGNLIIEPSICPHDRKRITVIMTLLYFSYTMSKVEFLHTVEMRLISNFLSLYNILKTTSLYLYAKLKLLCVINVPRIAGVITTSLTKTGPVIGAQSFAC